MAKPHEPSASEGVPEWMVSYADLITIMMAFFVVMYAMSTRSSTQNGEGPGDGNPHDRRQEVMDSLNFRFGKDWRPLVDGGLGLLPGNMRLGVFPSEVPRPKGDDGKSTKAVESGGDSKSTRRGRIVVWVPGRGTQLVSGGYVYFDGQTEQLSEAERTRLRSIAGAIAGKPQKIQLLGHTSNRPLPKGSPHRDHWDLAYARCRVVMDLLVDMDIDPQRIRMGVAGSHEPMHLGFDPDLGKQNDRVDVYLLDIVAEDLMGTPKERAKRYTLFESQK